MLQATDPVNLDRKEVSRFLKLLDPQLKGSTFQTFHDHKPPMKSELAKVVNPPAEIEVLRLHKLGAGIYVTVNQTDLKGRKSENITCIRAVWHEDDNNYSGEFPLTPSLIVETSPRHFHRYWFVFDDWPADEQGRVDFAAVMDRMVESYGSDKNAKDVTRVLRVPGFLHRKNGTPHLVHIVATSSKRYSRAEIMAAFPKVEHEQKPRKEWKPQADEDERIQDALHTIDAEERDTWLQIGMALKAHMGESGRSLWDGWSGQSKKYDERDQQKTWTSFHRNGIGIGTLFHHAKQSGWKPSTTGSKGSKQADGSKDPPVKASDWDDPDISLLDNRRGTLPDFPIDVFSPTLQQTLKRTAKGAGVTVAHVVVPFIGITSSLIGYSRRVKAANSWFEPATCCTALVGYSGTGKTPAHNVTRKPLRAVERLQKEKEEKRKRDHETKRTKAKAEYDNWKAKVEEAVETGLPVPDMPASAADPGKYVPIRLVVNDSTVERLAELLQVRPQGIVLVRDELAALYMNMSRYNGGQDDEFWLESWNGIPHTVERMGRNLDIDHLLIGIVGGMQPDKLVASFEGDHDGKYARVLFAWPDEPEWLGLSNEASEIDPDIQNIISRVLTLAEFEDDRLLPLVIALDAEAENEFEQFAQFAHREKKALEGREREWWAKATAHVLRLVNTLTYVEWGLSLKVEKPDAVSKATMQAAIRLVRDYFWPHARACLRLIGLTERHTNAKRVLCWIQAKGKTEVSREDIRRDALSQRLDAAQTDDLLKGLCTSGWLREEVIAPGPQGGKPVHRWLVNPKLHKNPTALTAETAETS